MKEEKEQLTSNFVKNTKYLAKKSGKIMAEVLCQVDLAESEADGVCTFVQAHGKHMSGFCCENGSVEEEIIALTS